MSDDTAREASAPSFLHMPGTGPGGGPVLFSHDTVIIFGTAHIFSNVITHPLPSIAFFWGAVVGATPCTSGVNLAQHGEEGEQARGGVLLLHPLGSTQPLSPTHERACFH